MGPSATQRTCSRAFPSSPVPLNAIPAIPPTPPGPTPPAILELGTDGSSIPRQLGPVKFDLGVIAGNFRKDTWLPGFPDGMSDGTVTVAEAIVPGMLDFLQLPVSHTFMIINPVVMRQVAHFLHHGEFAR